MWSLAALIGLFIFLLVVSQILHEERNRELRLLHWKAVLAKDREIAAYHIARQADDEAESALARVDAAEVLIEDAVSSVAELERARRHIRHNEIKRAIETLEYVIRRLQRAREDWEVVA